MKDLDVTCAQTSESMQIFQLKDPRPFQSSPKHIVYNSYISDNFHKTKGRYRLRNCRQPHLKIEQSEKEVKVTSYRDLKEVMRQKIEKTSLKKQYDQYCEKLKNPELIDKLRTELNFFPQKMQNKYRIKGSRKSSFEGKNSSYFKSMQKNNQNKEYSCGEISENLDENESRVTQYEQNNFIDYELKYRTTYLPKSLDSKIKDNQRQEVYIPLTGWN